MPFTVDDFEDLLRLLYERPEWRDRLRELILPPELFELPRIAQELAEANRAERERVARLEAEQQATRQELRNGFAQTGERLDRVEGRLGDAGTELAAFRTETNERFDRVEGRLGGVEGRLGGVEGRLGGIEGRLEGVEGRLGGVEGHLEGVKGRLGNVESDLTAFRTETGERFDRMDRRFDFADIRAQQTNTDLGTMKGIGMEARYRERLSWFRHLAPEPVALTPAEVSELIDHEIATGHLSQADGRRVDLADLILRGGEPGTPTYLVVEVSWLVDERDVRRARDRAMLLRQAGHDARGVVAGQRIQQDALALAERLGVERVIEDELDARDARADADVDV